MSFAVQTPMVKATPHFSGIPCLAELSVETRSNSCKDGKPGKIGSQKRLYLGTNCGKGPACYIRHKDFRLRHTQVTNPWNLKLVGWRALVVDYYPHLAKLRGPFFLSFCSRKKYITNL